MTNAQRQAHVDELAGVLNCEVIQRSSMPGMMYVEFEPPMIEGPIIVNQKDYMIMLHELGHVALGHTQGRPPFEHKTRYFDNGVLRSEAEAWEYALDNSWEENLLPETRTFMWERCLCSYLLGARVAGGRKGNWLKNGDRGYVSFIWDEPDEYFWSIRDLICATETEVTV